MQNLDLVREVTSAIPKKFVVDILTSIDWGYVTAKEVVQMDKRLGTPEAQWMEPYYRRGILERRLQDVAGLHLLKSNIATVACNKFQYTELFAGRFLITLLHASSSSKIVPSSSFRQNDARLNALLDQQVFLFDPVANEPTRDGVDLNAVIYHGQDRQDPSKAGFVKLGFPSASNTSWLHRLDMYDLLEAYETEPAIQEDQDLIIKWKRRSGEASA